MTQISDESKKIAIEFAKYICQTKITKASDIVDMDGIKTPITYWPHEFELILGELIKNEDVIFDNFIKNYNATSDVPSGELSSIV